MQIKDIMASKGLDFKEVETEFDDLFENAAMVPAAMKNCTTCERKQELSYLRETFTGDPKEFAVLAAEIFVGCCQKVKDANCPVYQLALKFEDESGIKACKSCPLFLENVERQGKLKCGLCKEAMAKYYK